MTFTYERSHQQLHVGQPPTATELGKKANQSTKGTKESTSKSLGVHCMVLIVAWSTADAMSALLADRSSGSSRSNYLHRLLRHHHHHYHYHGSCSYRRSRRLPGAVSF